MLRKLSGEVSGKGLRFAVVAARFNDAITDRLVSGAVEALTRHGASEEQILVVHVPGAFEIPLAAKALAETGDYDAVICLGALIRGATAHFDVLASQVTSSLGSLMQTTGLPIAFGVLTCESIEQAVERSGGKGSNKGADVALAAIEMANLLKELKAGRPGRP